MLSAEAVILVLLFQCSTGIVGSVSENGDRGRQLVLCILLVIEHPRANRELVKADSHMTLDSCGLPV